MNRVLMSSGPFGHWSKAQRGFLQKADIIDLYIGSCAAVVPRRMNMANLSKIYTELGIETILKADQSNF